MNKLFVIGNGFDLAHELPTSYSDFITSYWSNIEEGGDDLVEISLDIDVEFSNVDSLYRLTLEIMKSSTRFGPLRNKFDNSISSSVNGSSLFKFNNQFFRILNSYNDSRGWVDIEDLYYKVLKAVHNQGKNIFRYTDDINTLNREFAEVQMLLEAYLTQFVQLEYNFDKQIDYSMYEEVKEIFKKISHHNYPSGAKQKLLLEFNDKSDKDDINNLFFQEVEYNSRSAGLSHFLCFNYTSTIQSYFSELDDGRKLNTLNYIHGELNQPKNKINFGYGDEMDTDYKSIENRNINEYLQNFKSFKYLQNSNYKKLLTFIESDKYQVCIVGHSCGLSDRTLLKSIFENPNCRSIKVFYHEKDGVDNYTELIQNISRHFTNKPEMRKKIAEKSLSTPLPQNARFIKKN